MRNRIDAWTSTNYVQSKRDEIIMLHTGTYSSPALLKQWEDDVIKAGWAYGGGRALEGKEFMLAVSTGSPADSYTREGSHVRTMEELLSPFETTFRHTHATYLKPFLIQGVATSTDEQIDAAVAKYPAALIG